MLTCTACGRLEHEDVEDASSLDFGRVSRVEEGVGQVNDQARLPLLGTGQERRKGRRAIDDAVRAAREEAARTLLRAAAQISMALTRRLRRFPIGCLHYKKPFFSLKLYLPPQKGFNARPGFES